MTKLSEEISKLKAGTCEQRLIADFVDELKDEQVIEVCNNLVHAARALKDAATPPVLVIRQETDPMSPRDWDNLGTMVCWHRNYRLGDQQPKQDPDNWRRENVPTGSMILNLYLYDHSGISMSVRPFSDIFDSGQVGWIFASPEVMRKEFGLKRLTAKCRQMVEETLRQEVKTYDQYLRGAVWGYTYGDDVCWGFFGDRLQETGILEALDYLLADVVELAWEERK